MIFSSFLLKILIVRAYWKPLDKVFLTSAHNQCYWAKRRKITSTPVKPTFPYIRWDFSGCSLHGIVNMMIWMAPMVLNRHAGWFSRVRDPGSHRFSQDVAHIKIIEWKLTILDMHSNLFITLFVIAHLWI